MIHGHHPDLERDPEEFVKISVLVESSPHSRRTIRNWIVAGTLKAERVGNGNWYVKWGDWLDLLDKRQAVKDTRVDDTVVAHTLTTTERAKQLAKGRPLQSPQVAAKQGLKR